MMYFRQLNLACHVFQICHCAFRLLVFQVHLSHCICSGLTYTVQSFFPMQICFRICALVQIDVAASVSLELKLQSGLFFIQSFHQFLRILQCSSTGCMFAFQLPVFFLHGLHLVLVHHSFLLGVSQILL